MNVFLFLTGCLFFSGPQTVSVTVSSSSPEAGQILLAAYASEADFLQKREVVSAIEPKASGEVNIQLALPAPGTYALAAFHDLNGNGKLDRNFFGIPTEPYGFSRLPESKWEEPKFADLATAFGGTAVAARLELKLWKEY